MFNIEGLTSLLGQVGKYAPSIYNSLNAGQTASNPYLQNYNKSQQQPQQGLSMLQNTFAPQQDDNRMPDESIMPFPKENGFKEYSSDGGGDTPVLTGGVEKTGGFKIPFPTGDDTLSGGIDLNSLTSLLGQNGLGSLLGGQSQQTQPQGNVYNQMMPSPMLPQQMLPMMQNTFVPQTQMQNFQPYSLLNGNLG